MSADRIAAYTYQAEMLCPACMRRPAAFFNESIGKNAEFVPLETLLDRWAEYLGWDRYDESTYDSDDFPKVVFESQVTEDEECGNCGEEI